VMLEGYEENCISAHLNTKTLSQTFYTYVLFSNDLDPSCERESRGRSTCAEHEKTGDGLAWRGHRTGIQGQRAE